MTIEEMKNKLILSLNPDRYEHSIRVMEEAQRLAAHYQLDVEKAAIAGLLHDCAKQINNSKVKSELQDLGVVLDEIQKNVPSLLHSILSPHIAKEQYAVADQEILGAIRCHTTGKAGMTGLEKVIFVADYIECGRSFNGLEKARKAAYQDLNLGVQLCSELTIQHIISQGSLLHPDTIATRNDAILSIKRAISHKEV